MGLKINELWHCIISFHGSTCIAARAKSLCLHLVCKTHFITKCSFTLPDKNTTQMWIIKVYFQTNTKLINMAQGHKHEYLHSPQQKLMWTLSEVTYKVNLKYQSILCATLGHILPSSNWNAKIKNFFNSSVWSGQYPKHKFIQIWKQCSNRYSYTKI